MEKDENILKEAEEEAQRIKAAETTPVEEKPIEVTPVPVNEEKTVESEPAPIKEDNKKTGNNKIVYLLLTIIVLLIVAIILIILFLKPNDKKSNNNGKESNNNTVVENKEEKNNTENVENKESNNSEIKENKEIEEPKVESQKSVALIKDEGNYNVKIIYDDDSFKDINNQPGIIYGGYLDNNVFYYKDKDNNFYSLDISNENAEPQKIEYEFGGTENKYGLFRKNYSVVDGKVYYFTREDNNVYANSYDLNSNAEEKQQIDAVFWGDANFSDGVVAYFIANQDAFYSYNFITKELKKVGNYSYSTTLLENKENYMLLSTDSKFCVYDKKKDAELYCIPYSDITRTEQINVQYPITLKGSSILLYSDNKIVECTDSNSCDKVVYTLTEEQQSADYKDIIYYSNKLILELGYNPSCNEGCTCETYESYNVLDNNKKMPFNLDSYGYKYRFFE